MDLLFSKYASPCLLIDVVIRSNGFFDFVIEFFKLCDEEKTWQVWLHKVYDKSFIDFKNSLGVSIVEPATNEQIETTVKNSKNLLNGFIPET